MSYFIDTKYLNQIGHRLPLFKKKKQDVWNCRCVLCGDSATDPKKARGFFYRNKTDLYYKCHNCSASQHFGTFLKRFDPLLYQQYVFERYSSGENGPKAHTNAEDNIIFEQPVFKKDLSSVAQRLDTCPELNEAVQYCLTRGIPRDKFSMLYYIPHVEDIKGIAPQYKSLRSQEPRLALPLYNASGDLTGVSMRAMRGEQLRYIMIKVAENDEALIFGLNELDRTKTINVVEGPIDSLFLDNAIACCGTSFGKLESLDLPKENLVIIFDNQPRNKEVCKLIKKYIDLEYHVCIWPESIYEKDINDMALMKIDVANIIAENTHFGLMAALKFSEWRRC